MNLTELGIRALQPPETGQRDHFDDSLPGFGIRISQGGTRSFFVFSGSKHQRERSTIGRYPLVSLAQAREIAKALLAERTLNQHRPPSIKFEEAYEQFKKMHCARKRPRTSKDYQRILDKYFFPKLRSERLEDISPHTLIQITDKLVDTPREQAHTQAVARMFFRWCVRRHYLRHSPLEAIQINKLPARDRVLSDAEVSKVWHAADEMGWPFGRIIQLCILLGQRRSETAALRRSWIDTRRKTVTFPREVMKGNRQHVIPYGNRSAAILKTIPDTGDYLFPARGNEKSFNGWSKATEALRSKLDGVVHFTPHDLRRTFASNLQKLGIRLEVTEALLGHVSGSTGGIVGVYQRHEYGDEKRDAMEKWEKRLTSIVKP